MADNTFDIKGGSNQILPNAKEANQYFIGDSAIKLVQQDTDQNKSIKGEYRFFIIHDNVGVPDMIRKARHHIVLHAAFYPKYGFDNQGDDVSNAMAKNANLRLTAIFTDFKAPWVEEFAVTLRDYFAEKGKFAQHLDITKDYFVHLRNQFGPKRVHICDTARLPMFPIILIDDTIIVGHYAHSGVIPPNGLWFSIKHPKIPAMYESLLAGSAPECETPEESAIIRYLEELIVE